jgi:hypothetical protein
VPAQVSFAPLTPKNNRVGSGLGFDAGQNKAEPSIAWTSLPYDPFTACSTARKPIRVGGPQALPSGQGHRTASSREHLLADEPHQPGAGRELHLLPQHAVVPSWEGPTQRVTAWHGIQMARDLNVDYMKPLTEDLPGDRLGPTGDVAKVNCATCHQGQQQAAGRRGDGPGLPGADGRVAATPAAAALPPPVAEATALGAVLRRRLAGAGRASRPRGWPQLIASMAQQGKTVASISGYHSAAGTLAANQELAKQRAFSVRDALAGCGRRRNPREAARSRSRPRPTWRAKTPLARRVEVTVQLGPDRATGGEPIGCPASGAPHDRRRCRGAGRCRRACASGGRHGRPLAPMPRQAKCSCCELVRWRAGSAGVGPDRVWCSARVRWVALAGLRFCPRAGQRAGHGGFVLLAPAFDRQGVCLRSSPTRPSARDFAVRSPALVASYRRAHADDCLVLLCRASASQAAAGVATRWR